MIGASLLNTNEIPHRPNLLETLLWKKEMYVENERGWIMPVKLFDRLERAGLVKRNRLRVEEVYTISFSRLIDLLDKITADTFQLNKDFRVSNHTHCASFDLGGTADECCCFECRFENLTKLARFAALYSDQVIIHNYLAAYSPSWGHPPGKDSDEFRGDLIDDIQLLLHIRPLIEANNVVVLTPPSTTCPYCYAKKLFGSRADQRLKQALKVLMNDLLTKMSVEFFMDEMGYAAKAGTPPYLFKNQTHLYSYSKLPKALAVRPLLAKRISDGQSLLLPRKIRYELNLHSDLAEMVLTSLRYQMSVAEVVGASFLTDRDVDTRILSHMSNDRSVSMRNEIAAKHLNAVVPFAGDVPIDKLLQLRKREEGAFVQFRAALDVALKEIVSQRGSFTERDARALYSDIIAPEIAKLDQRVKEAKRDLIKAPLASAAGTTAMIAFGLYSGMVPAELKQIATALGLAKVAYDTASKVVDLADTQKLIWPERFYFLWRVKNIARKQRALRRNS